MGVKRKIKEHTDWCSSTVYNTKRDGSLRIRLHPKKLNEAMKRCPHKTPMLEEINLALVGAKYSSKLDTKAGYWSVSLWNIFYHHNGPQIPRDDTQQTHCSCTTSTSEDDGQNSGVQL